MEIEGRPFAPSSLLNRMRREAVERLQEMQGSAASRANPATDWVDESCGAAAAAPVPELHLLVRTPAQLEAAIAVRPAGITLDYLDLYGLKPSLERVNAPRAFGRVSPARACSSRAKSALPTFC